MSAMLNYQRVLLQLFSNRSSQGINVIQCHHPEAMQQTQSRIVH